MTTTNPAACSHCFGIITRLITQTAELTAAKHAGTLTDPPVLGRNNTYLHEALTEMVQHGNHIPNIPNHQTLNLEEILSIVRSTDTPSSTCNYLITNIALEARHILEHLTHAEHYLDVSVSSYMELAEDIAGHLTSDKRPKCPHCKRLLQELLEQATSMTAAAHEKPLSEEDKDEQVALLKEAHNNLVHHALHVSIDHGYLVNHAKRVFTDDGHSDYEDIFGAPSQKGLQSIIDECQFACERCEMMIRDYGEFAANGLIQVHKGIDYYDAVPDKFFYTRAHINIHMVMTSNLDHPRP